MMLKIIEYKNIFNLIISKTVFFHVIMQIIRNLQSDFHVQFSVLRAFQLVIKIYASTFFADMIVFYLLLQLITHSSLSATNLVACHAEHVIIMNKNFLHVHHMSFLLEAADTNSDQENML